MKELVIKAMKTLDDSHLQNYVHQDIFELSELEIKHISQY